MTAEIPQNHIQLVSQTQDGVQGNGESLDPSLSQDGRYVAFDSESSNLITNDINGDSEDVFRKDLTTGELKLVSVRADGVQSSDGGEDASISGDGSVVGFESWATDLDNNHYVQGENVYVKELDDEGWVSAVGSGSGAAMALDGRHIAFTSENALVGGDTNGRNDVYMASAGGVPLRLVSTNAAGVVGDGESEDASISADGRYVAFAGDSTNLVPGVEIPAHADQIFVKDTVTGAVILASCRQDGTPGSLDSECARISADGRHIIFTSIADNFGDGFCDIALYWKNLETGELKRVAGGTVNDDAPAAISADGRYVAFTSCANSLVAGDTNNTMDVFVMDMETNEITRVSTAADGTQGNAVSFAPAISADGSVVAFASLANNLVGGDHNHNVDVFAVERDIVVANDDKFQTTFDTAVTGSVFAENGGGSLGADRSTFDRNFTVGKVNGVEANVGQQVTLASGALLTLNADGTFSYDPNHAFDGRTGPQTDSFTYAIIDELGHHDHATVTLSLSAPHIVTEINGTEGNDTLIGTAGDDIINARGGHDYVEGSSGADTIYGGDGDDSLYGGAGADVLEGGAGNDYLRSGDSNGNWDEGGNTLTGGTGNDSFDAYGNNNLLEGGEGNDYLNVNGNGNVLAGGDGDDYLYANGGNNTLNGGDGNDTIQAYNYMYYESGGNAIDAGAGDDRVNLSGYYMMMGGSSSDIVTLGEGRDTIGFTSSPSMTFLATVTDFATGASGDKVDLHKILHGLGNYNGGNPFGDGHIRLFQDGGDTLLQVAQYGNGYDTSFTTLLRFQNTTVANFTSDNFLPAFSPDGAAPIGQTIDGTDGDDIITGTAGDDIINARGGNDHVDGSAGADAIYGGDGNDTLYGGLGSDTLEGGAGDDYLSSGNGSDYGNWTLDTGNTLRGGTGADELDAYGTNNVVEGDEGNDYLYIGGEGNAVSGGADDDYIQVNGSSNIVSGGSGSDYVYVHGGGNTISGGDGNDTIESYNYYASSGNAIDAGAGDDRVYLSNYYMMVGGSAETVTLGEGRDTIGLSYVPSMNLLATVTDFAPGTDGDKVDLNQILTGLGNFGGANPFGDGHIRLVQDGDDTLLQVDQYGNSDGANFTTLLRLQNTTVADFTADNFLPGFNPDGSAPAPVDEYLVSQTWYGAEGDGFSASPVISADGQWVAFKSNAQNLVSPDNNPYGDILVKNLGTGEIIRASTNASGEQANGDCGDPSISADGSKVAFLSWSGDLVPGVNPNGNALFVKNLSDGSITCVAQGVEDACISRDGQYVTFSSYGNLVAGDTNGTCSIYRARTDGTNIRLVSVNEDEQADNGEALYSSISGDGQFVLFASNSTNLVEGHDSGAPEYYLKDMDSGAVTAVAPVYDVMMGNNYTDYRGAISADGQYVLFDSFSSNIVPGTGGGALYWKDMETGETKLVADGVLVDLDKFKFSISGDGNLVSFTSYASTLVEGDTNNTIDAFVKNMTTGEVQRVDVPSDGGQANAFAIGTSIADDGTVAFASFASNLVEGDDNRVPDVFVTKPVFTGEVYVAEPETGTAFDNSIQQISNYSSGPGSISANGQYVAFQTCTPGDGVHDAVYLKNLATGETVLVSTNTEGQLPNDDAYRATVSIDGQRVAFASGATDIVEGVGALGERAIYVRDLASHETYLIASGTKNAAITADGNQVLYGLNGKIYLAPATGGAAQLVSENAAHEQSNGTELSASVSANGEYVAFVSSATNLVPGDTNGLPDVFVKNMQTGVVERVAAVWDDSFAGMHVDEEVPIVISADGRHVVFASFATNIISGVEGGALFWKDLDTHEVKLVATGVAGSGDFEMAQPSMSTDGRYVSFSSYASELVPGDTNNSFDVFVKDMDTGNVKRVSTAADGKQGDALSAMSSLSGDGSTVTFMSFASNLVPGDNNSQIDVFVARTGFGEANPDNHAPTVEPLVTSFTEDAFVAQGPGHLLLATHAEDEDGNVLSVVNVANEFTTTAGRHFVRDVDYTVTGDGTITITDAGKAQIESLQEGESDAFTLNFGVTDGFATTPDFITVTLTGNNDAPEVEPASGAVSKALLDEYSTANLLQVTGATDADGDPLSVVHADASVTTPGGRTLALGTDYTVASNGDIALTASGIAMFQSLAAGETDTFTLNFGVTDGHVETPDSLALTVHGDDNALVELLGGEGFGEEYLYRNDDSSTGAIDITAAFPDGINLFGHTYTSLYVNNNGNLTFDGPLGQYTPFGIAGSSTPIIAAYFADVDTGADPTGAIPTPGGTSNGSNLVRYDVDAERGIFTATWDDVGYFASHLDKQNAFQIQLLNKGDGDFDIRFIYEAVNWTTGDASDGVGGFGGVVARAGYSAGDQVFFNELGASGDQAAMLALDETPGNTGLQGVYEFQVRNGIADFVVARNDTFSTGEAGPVTGNVFADNGNGVDYDTLGHDITVSAINGSAAGVGADVTLASGAHVQLNADGTFDYNPNGAFDDLLTGETGHDSFTYTVSDNMGAANTAMVNIDIAGSGTVNHAPTADPIQMTLSEDATTVANLFTDANANDIDGDTLSFDEMPTSVVSSGGRILHVDEDYTINSDTGTITLTQNWAAKFNNLPAGATDTVTLNYGISDGTVTTPNVATFTIVGANDAPNGNDDYFATTEDSTAVGNVLANDTDIDGDALSVTAINDVVTAVGTPIALASGATLLVNANGDMTYDPNGVFDYLGSGQTASDEFSYTVSDGAGGEVTRTAHVTVEGVTDYNPLVAPLVQENSGLTFVNAEYSGAPGAISPFDGLNLGNVEGQPLTLGAGVLLTTGSAIIPDVNTQPGFTGDNGTPGYAPLQALLSGLGVGNATYDASVLTVTFTTNGELGAAQNVSIDVVFGSEEFPEYVNDYVDIAGVFVDGVNYALFDANSTSTPLSVLATNVNAGYFLNNDYNHQEQYGIPFTELPIEYNGLSRPLTITGALNPNLTEHTIVVAIADTQDHVLDSGIFISNLHVTDANTGINMLPNAVDDTVAAADNAVTTFDLLQNDTDPDGNALGITEINGTPVSNGTSVHLASGADVTLNADGTVSYNPNSAFEDLNAGETGEDSFTYSISDGHGGVDAATVNVSVNGSNDENTAPTVEAIEVAFEEDTEASGNLLEGANAQDADGDTLTVVAVDDTVTTTGGRDLVLGTDFTVATDGSAALTAAGAAKFNDLGAGQSDSGVLNFGVSDGTNTTMTTLTVTVTGMNDTPTAGTLDNVSVHENSAAGTLVGTLGGVDPDVGDALSYSLIDDAGGRFAIADGNQLVVGAGGTLDHEETSAHSVVVRITDASGAVFDQSFTIGVENVNETPDSLSLDGGNVSEMATAGTVVGTLTASDPDAGDAPELEFALSDNAGGRFEIVGNEIRLADGVALDYEATNSYQIAVDVTDAGGLTRTETFTINVTNEDEAPTAITMQGGSVAENSAAGTVAAELGVNDPDGPGTYNYAIINDPSGLFTLDGNKVVVAEGANLDYETATSHTLRVQVTDWSGLSYEQDITIAVEDVNPHIIGTNASNVLTGTVETDLIEGLGGNDTLNGGVNVDTLVGGTGNDTYVIDDRDEDVTTELAGEGTDTVQLGATYADASYHLQENIENLTALGSSGIALYGNALDNRLTGNSGNDTLDGGAGADTMTGGAGDDIYYVDNAGDRVTETGGGTDEVRTALAAYSMASMSGVENLSYVGAGNFSGTGNSLANTMTGGSGADRLDGKTGADTLIGLDGNDVYVVDNAGDIVVEVADGGTDTVESSINYTLGDGVENLVLTGTRGVNGTGNALDNLITGNSGANILDGGAGTDTLAGGAGNDTYLITDFADIIEEEAGQGTDTVSTALDHFSLAAIDNVENLTYTGSGNFTGTGNALANAITGGSGNDVLDGGAGADTLRGGAGDDTYYVDNTSDRVYENSGAGIDTVSSSINFTLGSNQENLVLTGAAVAGTGNGLANTLTGSDIANTLSGGAGGDRLIGNGGDDTLTGGSAADTFVFAPGFGHDTITDFSATGATHDILEFDASIFGGDLNVLLANAEQVGSNVTITIDADTSVTLQHVNKTALNSTNTHFVSDFDFT